MEKKDNLTCYCSVCDSAFQYGDEVSPMFTDEVWTFLVKQYDLVEHEISAVTKRINSRTAKLSDRDAHTFICKECAATALGRPIRLSDITRCHFNRDFLISYFSLTPEQVERFINKPDSY